MLNDRILLITNLIATDLKDALDKIHSIHRCTHHIKEYNSNYKDNIFMTRLFSKVTVNEIVKNIHKQLVNGNIIYVIPYTKYDERNFDAYNAPSSVSLHELLPIEGEQFCVGNDNVVSLMNMTEMDFSVSGNCAVMSPMGMFLAVGMPHSVIVYGNNKKFDEINIQCVTNMYFGSEVYLVIEYKEVLDFVCVVNVVTGRKLFNGRIGKNKINFIRNGFCIENTNKIFIDESRVKDDDDSFTRIINIFDKKYQKESFKPVSNFMGYNESLIVKVYQHANITAILTSEKIPHVVIMDGKKKIKDKNYVNLEDCRFVSSANRLYFLITKCVSERSITTIETYMNDNFTFTQVDPFNDISVSDTGFVLSTKNNEICFYKFESTFVLCAKIQKTHKTILALNPNGIMCAIYDYAKDKIEFYHRGQLISKHSHSNCNSITWSHSGLYCASVSSGQGSSGLVQVFDINGNLRWKKLFNKLSTFMWRGFYSDDELLEKIEIEHKDLIEKVEEDQVSDNNLEEEKARWIAFLEDKRKELIEFGGLEIE